MATKRVKYVKTKRKDQFEPSALYANFMSDLLDGTVTASKLVETTDNRGNLELDYDDPTGVGQSAQAGAKKDAG